ARLPRAAALASLAAPLSRGGELLRGFGQWWLRELLELFPQRMSDWLVDSGRRSLLLVPEPGAVVLQLATGRGRPLASRRIGRKDYASDRIDAFLYTHRQRRNRISLGLSLPPELIFARTFVLPLAARPALETVMVQDLLTKTPFQLDDIHHGHRVS